jgi:hypothetical protein
MKITSNLSGVKGGLPARKADLIATLADFLGNLGTSASQNPIGLHSLLQEYIYPSVCISLCNAVEERTSIIIIIIIIHNSASKDKP